jgi:Flp pilus assembly protein TadG
MSAPPPESARPRRRGLLSRFARSRKGVAAVEFGMVAIPLLGLICAIFETAFVFFTQEAFSNAVNNAARQVLVNSYASNSTPTAASFLSSSFCPQLPSFIACSKVALNVQAYPSTTNFSTITVNNSWYTSYNSSNNLNLGQHGNIVVFQAYYAMPVYLSVLVATGAHGNSASNLYANLAAGGSSTVKANSSGTGFVHAIFSTVVFRNEPT